MPLGKKRRGGRAPSVFYTRDLLREVLTGVAARPGRAALTVLGTVIGVAAFVAVLGLTATAQGQVSKRFTVLMATEVTVEDAPADSVQSTDPGFPSDAEERIANLNGVSSAGLYWTPERKFSTSTVSPLQVRSAEQHEVPLMAVSPGFFGAIHAKLSLGRTFDKFHDNTGQRVALLGRSVAQRLGISRISAPRTVFIGDLSFVVMGIVEEVDRHPETLISALIPLKTAVRAWGSPTPGRGEPIRMIVDVRVGASGLIAKQAPYALRPQEPDRFRVLSPPAPGSLHEGVTQDLGTLFLLLAVVSVIVGAVGIANTTLVAVLERIPEIGLRRSLGAKRKHIVMQFLMESSSLGLLGGLLGCSAGVLVVMTTAAWQDWTPILEPMTVLFAPLIGGTTGLVAGCYPAWRAGKIEPVEALRR